ncbi:MAG: DUF4004 family protein [Oscillospiraceae bacterium]|nr:DUF4004 family protein [Oscillospiraceae bacterium]
MDPTYISKRELLEMFGVSYGALYRWKRMGLIPEDWFLRKSTSTGQETFFRREQIIPRLEQILDRSASLEELANQMNPPQTEAPKPLLVVRNRYGVHRFPLEELEAVSLMLGDEQIQLLDSLKGAFTHE